MEQGPGADTGASKKPDTPAEEEEEVGMEAMNDTTQRSIAAVFQDDDVGGQSGDSQKAMRESGKKKKKIKKH